MSVAGQNKTEYENLWAKAKPSGGKFSRNLLPEGTYQFKVTGARFHTTSKLQNMFIMELLVVGGNDAVVGKETSMIDNLVTEQNMGFFKGKLEKLGVVAETYAQLTDKSFAEGLVGVMFEGAVKNDATGLYQNIYVNSRSRGNGLAGVAPRSGQTGKPVVDETIIEAGDEVAWGDGEKGTVKRVDGPRTLVEKEDGAKIWVKTEKLESIYEDEGSAAEKEGEEEAESEEDSDTAEEAEKSQKEEDIEEDLLLTIPDPASVKELTGSQVRREVKDLGINPDKLRSARVFLQALSILVHKREKAKLSPVDVSALVAGLGLALAKGATPQAVLRALQHAADEKFVAG